MNGSTLLEHSPVLPVVVLDDPGHAVPVVRALRAAGIDVLELTLRTPAALEALQRVRAEVPDMVVGAGTVTTPRQAEQAREHGAQFLVTPGCTDELLDALQRTELPVLPGIGTVSEAMRLAERGYSALKFFPAEACGGTAFLRSIAGPLPDLRFCPTGGITPDNAARYLALANVGCVGGSWLVPAELVTAGDFAGIERIAAAAAALGAGS